MGPGGNTKQAHHGLVYCHFYVSISSFISHNALSSSIVDFTQVNFQLIPWKCKVLFLDCSVDTSNRVG